jgi:hypothetical protein
MYISRIVWRRWPKVLEPFFEVISVNLFFLFLAEEPVLAQIFGALAPKVRQILQDQRRQKTGPSFTETNNERN